MLKQRFQCLQKHSVLQHEPDVATSIEACAVLHNVFLHFKEPQPEQEEGDLNEDNLDEPGPSQATHAPATWSYVDGGRLARQAQIGRLERIHNHHRTQC